MEQPSLLSFSLLGEVLFLGRRLLEQPRLSTPYCSGNLKIFDLKIFALKMKTKMKMGRFHCSLKITIHEPCTPHSGGPRTGDTAWHRRAPQQTHTVSVTDARVL